MITRERRLGRGLDALLGSTAVGEGPGEEIPIDEIRPNPYQPRIDFDPVEIETLANSIRKDGVLQPVVVRRSGGGYELVMGERRLRAAKMAGLTRIPAVIRQISDDRMLVSALVENVQRKDLNPVEKAQAFKHLADSGMTQEAIAAEVGVDRATVANFLRLLDLPPEIREAVAKSLITPGHARALLAIKNPAQQRAILSKIVSDELSVRDVEKLAYPDARRARSGKRALPPALAEIEQKLAEAFSTKVRLKPGKKGGTIQIDYYDDRQLNSILQLLKISI